MPVRAPLNCFPSICFWISGGGGISGFVCQPNLKKCEGSCPFCLPSSADSGFGMEIVAAIAGERVAVSRF